MLSSSMVGSRVWPQIEAKLAAAPATEKSLERDYGVDERGLVYMAPSSYDLREKVIGANEGYRNR